MPAISSVASRPQETSSHHDTKNTIPIRRHRLKVTRKTGPSTSAVTIIGGKLASPYLSAPYKIPPLSQTHRASCRKKRGLRVVRHQPPKLKKILELVSQNARRPSAKSRKQTHRQIQQLLATPDTLPAVSAPKQQESLPTISAPKQQASLPMLSPRLRLSISRVRQRALEENTGKSMSSVVLQAHAEVLSPKSITRQSRLVRCFRGITRSSTESTGSSQEPLAPLPISFHTIQANRDLLEGACLDCIPETLPGKFYIKEIVGHAFSRLNLSITAEELQHSQTLLRSFYNSRELSTINSAKLVTTLKRVIDEIVQNEQISLDDKNKLLKVITSHSIGMITTLYTTQLSEPMTHMAAFIDVLKTSFFAIRDKEGSDDEIRTAAAGLYDAIFDEWEYAILAALDYMSRQEEPKRPLLYQILVLRAISIKGLLDIELSFGGGELTFHNADHSTEVGLGVHTLCKKRSSKPSSLRAIRDLDLKRCAAYNHDRSMKYRREETIQPDGSVGVKWVRVSGRDGSEGLSIKRTLEDADYVRALLEVKRPGIITENPMPQHLRDKLDRIIMGTVPNPEFGPGALNTMTNDGETLFKWAEGEGPGELTGRIGPEKILPDEQKIAHVMQLRDHFMANPNVLKDVMARLDDACVAIVDLGGNFLEPKSWPKQHSAAIWLEHFATDEHMDILSEYVTNPEAFAPRTLELKALKEVNAAYVKYINGQAGFAVGRAIAVEMRTYHPAKAALMCLNTMLETATYPEGWDEKEARKYQQQLLDFLFIFETTFTDNAEREDLLVREISRASVHRTRALAKKLELPQIEIPDDEHPEAKEAREHEEMSLLKTFANRLTQWILDRNRRSTLTTSRGRRGSLGRLCALSNLTGFRVTGFLPPIAEPESATTELEDLN